MYLWHFLWPLNVREYLQGTGHCGTLQMSCHLSVTVTAQMLITCPFLPCSQMIQTSQTLLENSDSVYERILQVQKAGKNEKPYERTKAKTQRRARERHSVPQGTGFSWNTADRCGPSIAAPSEIERKHKCVHTKKAQRERTNYATLCYIRLIVHFSSPVWCPAFQTPFK